MSRIHTVSNFLKDPARRRLVAVVILLALIVTISTGVGLWWYTAGRFITAPNVALLTDTVARQAADAHDLKVSIRTEYSDDIEAGLVIFTDPAVGSRLLRGDTLELVISRGPQAIAITDYQGREAVIAKAEFQTQGFKVKVVQEHSPTVKKGRVISQTPSTGNGRRDDVINLVESLGPVLVQLPNVRYEKVEDAQLQLETLGVKVEVKYEKIFPLPVKIATGTEPRHGTIVAVGSTVILLVA